MRKIAIVSILTFAAVIVGALAISWYMQASQTKRAVEQMIAVINKDQTFLTHEGIVTSGFPNHVWVSVVKPHISGHIDQLIKAGIETMPDGPEKTEQRARFKDMPIWDENITLDGDITIGVNLFSNHYSMNIRGNTSSESTLGTKHFSTLWQSSGDTSCNIQLKRHNLFGALWSFEDFAKNGMQFLNDFRLFDCTFPPYVIKEKANGEVLFSSAAGRMYISSEPQGNLGQVRLFIKIADNEITKAGDEMMNAYMAALYPGTPTMVQGSAAGKQNFDMDFTYTGPMNAQAANADSVDVNLAKFDFTSKIANFNSMLHIASGVTGDSRSVQVAYKMTSEFLEPYDALLKDGIKSAIFRVYAKQEPQFEKNFETMRDSLPATAQEAYTALEPAIPHLQPLGKMVSALNFDYQGTSNMTTGDFKLSEFEISAAPYGITGTGTAKSAAPGMPAANINFVCRNCTQLVDDVYAYVTRVQRALTTLNPKNPMQPVNPSLPEGIKGFLQVLAVSSTKDGNQFYTYTLLSDGASNITLNGKRMDQVMSLYQQYVAPFLQKPQPAQ